MLKAVIFDMDGVIIDSEPMHARANILAMKKYGVDIPLEYCYNFIGSTTYYMCQKMIEDFHIDATAEELLKANNDMKDCLRKKEGYVTIPYVIDLMKDLKSNGMLLAIASSSPKDHIENVMSSLHIKDYIDFYVSGMQVKNPKPAPDIFIRTMELLNVNNTECIIIEDSMHGVHAAATAGILSIGFSNPNSGRQDLSKSQIIIESFDEINYDFIYNIYQRANHLPITIAETNRLIIRELTENDFDSLYQIYQSEETKQFITNMNEGYDIEFQKHKAYIKHIYSIYGYGLWGVFLKSNDQLIGHCGIENKIVDDTQAIELGYVIDKNYRGLGYGQESVKAILSYAFNHLQVPRIIAVIDEENTASVKLALKVGLHKICSFRRNQRNCFKFYIDSVT